jgi:hypothetical protein
MTQAQPKFSNLQRAEAAYLAANWDRISRSERRNVIRFWWKTGVRMAGTFSDHWRTIASTIKNAQFGRG